MADGTNYLGLRVSPLESGYGIGAQTLGQALPSLINPYGNVGTNLGITLGGALLQGLLAYQARSEATDQSIMANRIATQMLAQPDPTARLGLVEALDDTAVQRRLLGLNERMLEQQLAREQAAAEKVAERKSLAEFELGPLGEQLFTREQKGKEDYAKIMMGGKAKGPDEDAEVARLRREFNMRPEVKDYSKLRNAAATVALASQDPSAVASMELVKRAVHLIEPGLAALQGETEAVRRSGTIPGQWKANIEQALMGTGGLDDVVREGIINMAKRSYEVAKNSYEETRKFYEDEASTQKLDPSRISSFGPAKTFEELLPPKEDPAAKRKEELRRQIAEKKALLAQRGN
jgi:hypothetical protein